MPSDVNFFYVKTDIFDDEKIRLIESMPDSDTLLVLWIKVIAQAAKCNAEGWIYLTPGKPYTDEHLATLWRRPINTIRLALKLFEDMGMIHRNGDGIFVTNFMTIQNANVLNRIREATRQRVQRLRERRKLALPEGCNATSNVTGSATVTPIPIHDTDTDNNIDNIEQIKKCNVTNDDFRLPCGQTVGRLKRILLKETREHEGLSKRKKRFYYSELKRIGVPIDELMKEKGIEIDFLVTYEDE